MWSRSQLEQVYRQAHSPVQEVLHPVLSQAGVRLLVKRDDLLDPLVSGNKWRKLKYNLLALQASGKKGFITFGGAYSNHLHAVAAAGERFGFDTVGIVRGEQPQKMSATLQQCKQMGMQLHFVSREDYRLKEQSVAIQHLLAAFQDLIVLPEGGANEEAQLGCSEIISEVTFPFDYFATPCGTGATLRGLARNMPSGSELLGFSVLKGAQNLFDLPGVTCVSDYHFGGYAKYNQELLSFISDFEAETRIPLEQVYTGKLFFGLVDLTKKGYFKPQSVIVALHTGGLQGKLPVQAH